MKKLFCETVNVSEIMDKDLSQMFFIFQKYYSNTDFEIFKSDLSKKEMVFLLKDKETKNIKGFSTLVEYEVQVGNKKYKAAFSGDTILEKEYWGDGTLGIAFLKHLFMRKLKNPFSRYYWFLISKGYKTYLLMANNFPVHYPRYEKETPVLEKNIISELSNLIYAGKYDQNTGVIKFDQNDQKDALKCDVANISSDMFINPRINYFAQKNKNWQNGDELACLAEMNFMMPLFYQIKILKKRLGKKKIHSQDMKERKLVISKT